MYIWLFPLLAFAQIMTTFALLVVIPLLLHLRARTQRLTIRSLLLAALVVALLLSPAVVFILTDAELRRAASHGIYIHYSPVAFWLPAAVAVAVWSSALVLFPGLPPTGAQRWRRGFVGAAFVFLVLNLANQCSPGYCERFGFPFAYWWWSDALLIVNGQNLTGGNSMAALAANVAAFLSVSAIIAFFYRRRHLRCL